MAVGGTRPDLTLILDIPAEIGLRRVRARQAATGDGPDRFESDEVALHERRRQAYLALAARDPSRYAVIDAVRWESDVADDIWKAVSAHLLLETA